jgi:hypothetical protein
MNKTSFSDIKFTFINSLHICLDFIHGIFFHGFRKSLRTIQQHFLHYRIVTNVLVQLIRLDIATAKKVEKL